MLFFASRPEHFLRTITISGVPKSYGCADVADVINEHALQPKLMPTYAVCGGVVKPSDVVFR